MCMRGSRKSYVCDFKKQVSNPSTRAKSVTVGANMDHFYDITDSDLYDIRKRDGRKSRRDIEDEHDDM